MARALVVNAGSSSLKWAVLERGVEPLVDDGAPWRSADPAARRAQVRETLARLPAFDVVGHRVVHGGTRFVEATEIDAKVRAELEALAPLDPEHMAVSLLGVDAVAEAFPRAPQVAAFDTAFHATIPPPAKGYGVPQAWEARGWVRFGFHGLSVDWAVRRAGELLGGVPRRLVVAHLGSGCSVTAVESGRSVDTSMGFSPLEGPMMATRAGTVDPGLLLYLLETEGLSARELRETLTHRSGLLGVSGVSGDLREVLKAADQGSAPASLAYRRFVLGVRHALGAMAAALGGVDALVFTGGIGEHSERVVRDTAGALGFGGVELAAGTPAAGDGDLATPASRVRVLRVKAREELTIAREALRVLERRAR